MLESLTGFFVLLGGIALTPHVVAHNEDSSEDHPYDPSLV